MLQTEVAHVLGRRSDEGDPLLFTCLSKLGILAKKSVSRVNRLGARLSGGCEDVFDLQIALRGLRRTYTYGLPGHSDVCRMSISFRIDGYRRDLHPIERSDDAARDLSAVGYENLGKHLPAIRGNRSPRGLTPASGKVRPCPQSVPYKHFDRSGIICVARIVKLRAIRNKTQDIHLGAHLHILSRLGNSVGELQTAF